LDRRSSQSGCPEFFAMVISPNIAAQVVDVRDNQLINNHQ
jgi:hypothetical protein